MTTGDRVRTHEDVPFATVPGGELYLDLLVPPTPTPAPVAIYVHGGGWVGGTRAMDTQRRAAVVAGDGVAIASIDYRLGAAGTFPAAVHDVRAAVRWLRAHGRDFGLATGRIGAWGCSAGAHLALVAALGRADALEGDIGGNTSHSSAINAVVNWFGASDLVAKAARSPLERRIVGVGNETPFLGLTGGPGDGALLEAASPLALVHAGAPPVLTVHGYYDQVVPIAHSQRLHEALLQAGVDSTFVSVGRAGHEDPALERPAILGLVAGFLADRLTAPTS